MMVLFCLSACSTNPATGERQFTALMSPQQELQIGAQEHAKLARQYNIKDAGYPVQTYVQKIGRKIAAKTERPEVTYKFFVLDTPDLNAFALPGGYVYVTRGLLAYANDEAELAAVLGHEVAHITARHSAERYSHGVLTTLGASVLSATLDTPGAADALGLGSNLYIKSYSRTQEHQADEIGIRYLKRASYDELAMSRFLMNLEAHTNLQNILLGRGKTNTAENYFSTHPQTEDRIGRTIDIAGRSSSKSKARNKTDYFKAIDGIVYGHSVREGFVRDQKFIHPEIGFAFTVPKNFTISNQTNQIVARHSNGTVAIVDLAKRERGVGAYNYMRDVWMRGETIDNPERININGLTAATASFPGKISGRAVTIRIVAIEWQPNNIFRFQIAIPRGSSPSFMDDLKTMTYSFKALSNAEKNKYKPYRLRIVTAVKGDTVASIAARMPFDTFKQERFRVLNGLSKNDKVIAGQKYKIVSNI